MTALRDFLRGLRQRAGTSLGIALVAVIAAAAATTGPVYDAAARTSVMRDALNTPTTIDRAVEATDYGPAAGLASQAGGVLAAHLGGQAQLTRLFGAPTESLLVQTPFAKASAAHGNASTIAVAWHTDECAHLRVTSGTCPAQAGQGMVSASFASVYQVKPGDTIATSFAGKLTVTGIYAVPSAAQVTTSYWLGGPCDDFAAELSCGGTSPVTQDAVFTTDATFTAVGQASQEQAAAWWTLNPSGVQAGDLSALSADVGAFLADPSLTGISTTSSIPQLVSQVTADEQTLDVPVYLIAGQLLLLAWLLLFLIATDAAEARAPEIALARLRGYGALRTLTFGLAEPAALLLVAFPVGALAGWGFTGVLGGVLLRPGTPVGLSWLGFAAAAAATLGGLAAVALAARRVLTRPVTEQWQRTSRDAGKRGWVLDAVLLAFAAAGLAELFLGGYASGTRGGGLGLLVPGLLGLAVAIVASRVLPAACALAFGATRRFGGLAVFLAVRHIARRPSGTRTTIAVATSFAMASFALCAYAVGQHNAARVAAAQAGADAVLTVQAPEGKDLGTIVNQIDPAGTHAAAVDMASGNSNGSLLLAVQPSRWAAVAAWQPGFLNGSPASVAKELSPPTAPVVELPAGATALRVTIGAGSAGSPSGGSGPGGARLLPAGETLTVWVTETGSGAGGQTPAVTGPIPAHGGTVTAPLSGCPCDVTMLTLDPSSGQAGLGPALNSTVTLSGAAYQSGTAWTPLPALLDNPAADWAGGAETPSACTSTSGSATGSGGSVAWTFDSSAGCSPALTRQEVPAVLPAIVAAGLANGAGGPSGASGVQPVGLNGQALPVTPVAVAATVPGAPATGVVVDRTLALRAAYFASGGVVTEQVWTAPGAEGWVRQRLTAAGVQVSSVTTLSQARSLLDRSGPQLASVLFAATAGVAALLAAGAALLGLYQAGRRRRHEYAALVAGRVPRATLRASVLLEQFIVLGFGTVAGIATGLVAAALVLRHLPEFESPPPAPQLVYTPPTLPVAVPIVAALVVLAVLATVAALGVVRAARPELLRQAGG